MNHHVVVINGKAQNGKDTFIKFFQTHFIGTVISVSTVSEVKLAAEYLGVFEGDGKTDAKRKLWSDIKDAWTAYNDGPFYSIVDKIKGWVREFKDTPGNIVFFVHVREPEEIKKFKDYYGKQCTTVLISRPGQLCPENHADQNVEAYSYDFTFLNDGTLYSFEKKAQHAARMLTTLLQPKGI